MASVYTQVYGSHWLCIGYDFSLHTGLWKPLAMHRLWLQFTHRSMEATSLPLAMASVYKQVYGGHWLCIGYGFSLHTSLWQPSASGYRQCVLASFIANVLGNGQ